jgi:voltage-gated potassium channel
VKPRRSSFSRRPRLRRLVRRIQVTESYGLVLVLLLLTMGSTVTSNGSTWGRETSTILISMTLVLALWTSRVRHKVFYLGVCASAASIILVIIQQAFESKRFTWLPETINLLLITLTPIAMVLRLFHHRIVKLQTILGAICIYLLIGLFFTYLYGTIDLITPLSVFTLIPRPMLGDYLYFSFITMTTVGYGDVSPQGPLARFLALLEALTGQVYLVTVVALLVSKFVKEHTSGSREK